MNHVIRELRLPVSLEQRDPTPVGNQRMGLCLSSESGVYLEKFAPIPVWDQTQLYRLPLQRVESVPHPHLDYNEDVFLSPTIFWPCARIKKLRRFLTCLPVGITTSYPVISPQNPNLLTWMDAMLSTSTGVVPQQRELDNERERERWRERGMK